MPERDRQTDGQNCRITVACRCIKLCSRAIKPA